MNHIGIYIIKNQISGNFYIGSSKNILNRWKQHRYQLQKNKHPNIHLQNAWNKYGKESFTFLILEECECKKEILLEREQYYIDTLKPSYNLLQLAGSSLGNKHKEETKLKIKQSLQGRKLNSIHKSNIGLGLKNKSKSNEHNKKNSMSHAGCKNSFFGKKHTDETKKLCSEMKKDKTLYSWTHSEYGMETMCIWDLAQKYSLITNNLRAVVKGKYSHHKGWRLIP